MTLRTIECKSCGERFKYEFDENELRGGRRKYCDKCKDIRKQINDRESKRIYIERAFRKVDNPPITKKIVIHNAIRFILDLNKHTKITNTSSEVYDKVINMLPNNYITRDALRRQYREMTLKNEIR